MERLEGLRAMPGKQGDEGHEEDEQDLLLLRFLRRLERGFRTLPGHYGNPPADAPDVSVVVGVVVPVGGGATGSGAVAECAFGS